MNRADLGRFRAAYRKAESSCVRLEMGAAVRTVHPKKEKAAFAASRTPDDARARAARFSVPVGLHRVHEKLGVLLGRRGIDAVAEVHDVASVARL